MQEGNTNFNGGQIKEEYTNSTQISSQKGYNNRGNGENKGSYHHSKHYKQFTPKLDSMTVQYMIYQAEMYILTRYPQLIDLNKKNETIINSLNEKDKFFVIKSYSEEDVHKAIKYNVWTSTKWGNQTLSNAFANCEGSVYLFFSCNGSGKFLGICRMTSGLLNEHFPFWTVDNKWGGLFKIEWLFIKDVLFREFSKVVITLKDGLTKPVSFSRDTQEVPNKEGKEMFGIIQEYCNTNTLLEHFEYYDIRQENYEKAMMNSTNFQQK